MKNVCVRFGAIQVLEGFSIDIQKGEFVAIVGPSGCGKTTLLNLFSGFLKPTLGTVECHGCTRTVYQQNGLFPWMTVEENIRLGLGKQIEAAKSHRKLQEIIQIIGLEKFEKHYPHQLSGGMLQRAELGRALIAESDILLMDEPFSALDYLTRLRLRHELARMLEERPRTVVLVTHDIEEAAQLADRIIVLSDRPAHIINEVELDLIRPRDPTHPIVVQTIQEILAELGIGFSKMEA
jgi:ABC-type nitrate/sulfonate/bicarbonate transport system ATPase subunit